MASTKRRLALLIVLLVASAAGLLFGSVGHSAGEQPRVSWSAPTLEVSLFPGASHGVTLTFSTTGEIGDASLLVTPELSPYLNLRADATTNPVE